MTTTLKKPKNLSAVLDLAEKDAKKFNIIFQRNEKDGEASGKGFAGNYIIEADCVKITITKKPFVFSDSVIQKNVVKYWDSLCAQVK